MTAPNATSRDKEAVALGTTMVGHDSPPDGNDVGSQDCRNVKSEACRSDNTTGCMERQTSSDTNAVDASTLDRA
jgi:hypothetical protein